MMIVNPLYPPNEIYYFEDPVNFIDINSFEIKLLNKNKYYALLAKEKKRIILKKTYYAPPYDNDYHDCPICLLTLVNKNVLFTPCGHIFHTKCIKTMFNTNDPESSSYSITKYNCPLCRFNMCNSLKKIGYNIPIFINFQNHPLELIETVNTVLNIIANSFSPHCFRSMIRNYPAIQYDTTCICPFCNSAFIQYLHHSQTINNDVYEVINEYINEYNSIIELIVDVLRIISFVEADDYIRCIFPNYILS